MESLLWNRILSATMSFSYILCVDRSLLNYKEYYVVRLHSNQTKASGSWDPQSVDSVPSCLWFFQFTNNKIQVEFYDFYTYEETKTTIKMTFIYSWRVWVLQLV